MYSHIKIIVTIRDNCNYAGNKKELTNTYMCSQFTPIAIAGRKYAFIALKGLKCIILPFINSVFSPA